MIYFSEIRGKAVLTEDHIEVGKLDDLIFLASETPIITKIVVRGTLNDRLVIPYKYVQKINDVIVIKKEYVIAEFVENELYMLKNLLDKQIIDLLGDKVVRVNDIALQKNGDLYIVGVDIGAFGIIRSMGLSNIFMRLFNFFHIKYTSKFLSWADVQPLELARGQVKLKREEKRLEKLHPADLADYLEKTNIANIQKILKLLDDKFEAEVISDLNINYQNVLFRQFRPEKSAKILSLVDTDEAADILLSLSPKKRELIINLLPDDKKKTLLRLIQFAKTPLGDLINTEFLYVHPEETVKNVIQKIKELTSDFSSLITIYVVNKSNELVGVFSLHELLLQNLETEVYKFMQQNIIVAHLSTPVEIVAKKLLKYKLANLPVIDDRKHLLGLVIVDDVAKFILDKFEW